MIYYYGMKWSPKDHRDVVYGVAAPQEVSLPVRTNNKALVDWEAYSQAKTSSCTSHAAVGLNRFVNKREGLPATLPSRLFHYWVERRYEGTLAKDEGATIRSSMRVLANIGVCPEEDFPFVKENLWNHPSDHCFKDAVQNMVKQYIRIDKTPYNLKQSLVDGYPFVFGMQIYSSFENDSVAKTGIVPYPVRSDKIVGGHAILCLDYDDEKDWYVIMNSWGKGWGDNGFCYIPQPVMHSALCDDCFSIRSMETLDPNRLYKAL